MIFAEGRPQEWSIWTKHMKDEPEGWDNEEFAAWPEGNEINIYEYSNSQFHP